LYIVERGSRHILSQKEILEAIPGWPPDRPGVPAFDVAQNLAEYEAADIIAVPATHVVESFLEKGIARSKLFCNPYGVDLEMFPPTRKDPLAPSTVLYVGAWSMQKGVDLLLAACKMLKNVRLLHVGSKGDGPPFPNEPFFRHVDPVPQWELKGFYAMADVFVQPSRQEGLSLVQAQSLSCGLPLVCTDRTGGADLREFLPDPSMVTVVPHDDAPALAQGITTALERARGITGLREGLGKSRELLSWKAYGSRYSNFLERRVRTKQV
jgi:glycosyltransferase involved in cell wall biosynthesis